MISHDAGMSPTTELVKCPKYPDHGLVHKRLLSPEEREIKPRNRCADVFEIDCPWCGKYELVETLTGKNQSKNDLPYL